MNATTKKQVVVIAGPSGGGKNTIIKELIRRFPRCTRLVTATTRAPRQGERDGEDYYFLSEETFMRALETGDILEHRFAAGLGTHYGAYRPDLEKRIAAGMIVLAHLDIIGARYLKQHYNATTIFIMPDSIESLEHRVRVRNPDMSENEVIERMKVAREELKTHAPEYDYQVRNADGKLDAAVENVVAILQKEGYTLE